MKAISDELIRITTLLGVSYERASTLNQANTLIHYQDITSIIVIYIGYGNAEVVRNAGAQPSQIVDTSVYVLDKKVVVDELATNVDLILDATAQVAADIIENFDITPDLLDYSLEPVEVFDDMLVGYLLTFSPSIDAPNCSP